MFRLLLITVAIVWSLFMLPLELIRLEYRPATRALADGETVSAARRDQLITTFRKISALDICLPQFREQLAAFLLHRADGYSSPADVDRAIADLNEADAVLRDMLACAPFSPNQWLLFARLDALRHGVRENASEAIQLSYYTGPRELWVVKKRLALMKVIAPWLSEKALQVARLDIQLIRQLSPALRDNVLRALAVGSIDELERLFGRAAT